MQSSRDGPLNNAAAEPALVCQDDLSSCPSRSQPANHVVPGDVDLKLERQPDIHAGEEDDTPLDIGLELQDDGELSAEEIQFLEEFPRWEKEQEKVIAKLHALADDADSTHQKFTKTSVVAGSTSVISGVVSVFGLALAPLTAGGSLILMTAGQGVGLAASVINIVTDLMENSHTNNIRTQSNQLVPPHDGTFQKDTGGQMASYVRASGEIVYKCGTSFEVIRKHIHALRLAKAYPHLVPAARHLKTAGQVVGPVGRHVHKAFKDTALVMSQKALLKSGACTIFSLGYDTYNLQEKLMELKDKKVTELAEELRSHVLELKEEIFQMKEKYKALQQKKSLREGRLKKSPLKGAKGTQTQLGT
ncbi:apolipoprotein L6-like [Octodon degus]|uniref:Apolipoprotein L6-like n=1 Tax=Octodon degus TaxID=10160 RepID=A0A6P6ER53_OCTDE|nr:apolipoprotein L6-like [Octodon degus]